MYRDIIWEFSIFLNLDIGPVLSQQDFPNYEGNVELDVLVFAELSSTPRIDIFRWGSFLVLGQTK